MKAKREAIPAAEIRARREPWVEPVLEELPRLEELTLFSGEEEKITGKGSTSSGGSLFFH